MSAAILREAAALMRERAEAARPSPWVQNGRNGIHTQIGECIAAAYSLDDDRRKAEAQHIASWHPAVALAVADWLEAGVETWVFNFAATQGAPLYPGDEGGIYCGDEAGAARNADHHARHALAVARAYLGRDA